MGESWRASGTLGCGKNLVAESAYRASRAAAKRQRRAGASALSAGDAKTELTYGSAQTGPAVALMLKPPRRYTMTIRSAAALAALAALTAACTPPQAPKGAVVSDKVYVVTPNALTAKGGLLSGQLTEMRVVERVEEGSGRVDQPARLTGKLVLKNVSHDQSLRLLGGKLLYIDMQGKPI